MAEIKKHLWPMFIVVGAVASFIGGNQIRQNQDIGAISTEPPPLNVASIELPSDSPRKIPEGEYFYQLMLLLERDFVDPIADERKLAFGAVKGLIGGLWDPFSQFLPADHFSEEIARQAGEYHGLGIEIRLVYSPKELEKVRQSARSADPLLLLPELQVAFVVPGGPAEQAGIKVGDRITQVNSRWLLSWSEVQLLRDMQAKVASGKLAPDEFKAKRIEIQKKAKDSITIGRALDLLTSGSGKSNEIAWNSNGITGKASAMSAISKVPSVEVQQDGSVKLRIIDGASGTFAALATKSSEMTLDLRSSGLGKSEEILPILSALTSSTTFGRIIPEKGGPGIVLETKTGSSEPRYYKILVDSSTRGAAAIVALALKAKGVATLQGDLAESEAVWIKTVKLEDGSGYTLNTGAFKPDSVEVKR